MPKYLIVTNNNNKKTKHPGNENKKVKICL